VQGWVVAKPQRPEQLLAAESSAAFITDPELLNIIGLLENPLKPTPQVDLFDTQSSMAALH
jgi:hypothetical protein